MWVEEVRLELRCRVGAGVSSGQPRMLCGERLAAIAVCLCNKTKPLPEKNEQQTGSNVVLFRNVPLARCCFATFH